MKGEPQNPLIRAYKVARWLLLGAAVIALFLAFKSPSDPGPRLDRGMQIEQAQSFEEKIKTLEAAQQQGSEAEIALDSGELNAALAESIHSPATQAKYKEASAAQNQGPAEKPGGETMVQVPPEGRLNAERPADGTAQTSGDGQIKDVRVQFSSDVVTGYFITQAYGKEVHLTVAGRLGCKDGYATFEPTSFKIGDLSVPVSFVNPALQKKLAAPETREKLKLPDFVADLSVRDGRLIVTKR